MSGHSKWATIRRKKGKLDAERGRIFTRLIKEISVAARNGGGDPESNPRLRTAILTAKQNNMPADNIDRAIKKGTGELPGVVYEQQVYEGYGPGGVAIMIDTLTDNKNRTVSEIRHMMSKHGGNLGETNSVGWMFARKGSLTVPVDSISEDDLMMLVLEAGGEDVVKDEEVFTISTDIAGFEPVKKALEDKNIEYHNAELGLVPTTTTRVEGHQAASVLRLLEKLEEHDDVQKIYSNFDIDEEEIDKFNNS